MKVPIIILVVFAILIAADFKALETGDIVYYYPDEYQAVITAVDSFCVVLISKTDSSICNYYYRGRSVRPKGIGQKGLFYAEFVGATGNDFKKKSIGEVQ